jgi:PAS domain S-box-containing protein
VRVRKAGGRIHVSATVSPVKDESGNTIGVASIARDITERKRAEDEIRSQKEILQQIFDHVPVMLNFVDERGRIIMVNREWERTLGWTLEEIQKEQLDIFAECYPHPEYRQTVLQFLAESDGEWHDFKPRVKDGRIIDTTWAIVRLSDGTSIGIGKDVTDRKRAEKELRISRERLRSLAAYLQSVREEERTRIGSRNWASPSRFTRAGTAPCRSPARTVMRSIPRPRTTILSATLSRIRSSSNLRAQR